MTLDFIDFLVEIYSRAVKALPLPTIYKKLVFVDRLPKTGESHYLRMKVEGLK